MKWKKLHIKEKSYAAYMTIEASFIVPVAFLLTILLLFFGFFCYEKSVSIQCCYLAALRGSNDWEKSGRELEELIEQTLTTLIEEKHFYQIEREYEIDTGITEVKVSMKEKWNNPLNIVGEKEWDIISEKSAIRNKPSTYIRRYQSLKE